MNLLLANVIVVLRWRLVLIGKTSQEIFFPRGDKKFAIYAFFLLVPCGRSSSVGSYAFTPPTVGILAVAAITVRVAKRGWRYPIFSLWLVHDLGTRVS